MPCCSALLIQFMNLSYNGYLHKAVETFFIIHSLSIEYDIKIHQGLDVFAFVKLQIVHHNLKMTGLKVFADMRNNHKIMEIKFM